MKATELAELLGSVQKSPKGLLRVNATVGFSRSNVAPVISRFLAKYPQVSVQRFSCRSPRRF
jgi:LysR family transcriptional activator of dmlA